MCSFFMLSFFIIGFLNNLVIATDTATITRSTKVVVTPGAVIAVHTPSIVGTPDAAPVGAGISIALPATVIVPATTTPVSSVLGKRGMNEYVRKCEKCHFVYDSPSSFWIHTHRINKKSGKSTCQLAVAARARISTSTHQKGVDDTEGSSSERAPIAQPKESTDYTNGQRSGYEDEQDLSVCAVCYEEFVTPEELEEHQLGKMVTCASCGNDTINDACLDFHRSRCAGYRSATMARTGAGVPTVSRLLPLTAVLMLAGAGTSKIVKND